MTCRGAMWSIHASFSLPNHENKYFIACGVQQQRTTGTGQIIILAVCISQFHDWTVSVSKIYLLLLGDVISLLIYSCIRLPHSKNDYSLCVSVILSLIFEIKAGALQLSSDERIVGTRRVAEHGTNTGHTKG